MLLLFPVEMRLKVKTGINNCSLIDDYSSDFQSLEIALDFLESQKYKNKTVILSDIFQSGLSEELYSKLSQLIVSNNISRLIGIGDISEFKDKFANCITFKHS
jgi:alanine racemase